MSSPAADIVDDDRTGAAIASKLNWLRAGVLGANDGIVSTASIIFGVAGASMERSTILLAGIAAVAAGAMSMATGEYVSVSSQRDVEKAELARTKAELDDNPQRELERLRNTLEDRGIAGNLADQVAQQLSKEDALAAHANLELGIDPNSVVNPWQAAFASIVAFVSGGLIPLVAIALAAARLEIWLCGGAVICALALSGFISARLGRTPVPKSMARTVAGGLIGMAITYGVGHLAGTTL